MSEAKPFCITKWEVWEAYKRVKANHGAAGVDDQSIADFERNLKGNLYKIWNRMSSGSYFPPPVRTVKIPKANGGERKLGIPTASANCTGAQIAFRMGGDLPSVPPASRSALPSFEGAPNRRHRHSSIPRVGSRDLQHCA